MLIHYLHSAPVGAGIWIVILLLEILTLVAILRSGFYKAHQTFALYIYFSVVETVLLAALPVSTYQIVSAPATAVQCLLIAACVADLYWGTLDSPISLPDWVPRHMGALLAIAISVSAGLSISLSPQYGTRSYRILMGVVEAEVLLVAFALWILIVVGSWIGHHLTPDDAQIAIGFVLMLSVNAISLLVGLYAGKKFSLPALRVGQFFVILAFGWWSWRFWTPSPTPERATSDELAVLFKKSRETIAAGQDLQKVSEARTK